MKKTRGPKRLYLLCWLTLANKILSILVHTEWQLLVCRMVWTCRMFFFMYQITGTSMQQKKNRLEISEIPRAQWNVHSGWTDPTQATGTLDMVIVIVRRIQKSSTGDNNFVSSVRPIEITRPVKVDHFRSWSRILRSDQTKMVRSIWCTNRNFRNFGLMECAL